MATPSAKTLGHLRKEGWTASSVENFNHFAGPMGRRFDLFGFIDVIAIKPQCGVFGVQATSASNVSARIRKCLQGVSEDRFLIHEKDRAKAEERTENLRTWLLCGLRFEVWGWDSKKLRRVRFLLCPNSGKILHDEINQSDLWREKKCTPF